MKKAKIHFIIYFRYTNLLFLIILLLSCENEETEVNEGDNEINTELICLLYTSPSPRDS